MQLSTYPGNFRLKKIQITANYAGVKVQEPTSAAPPKGFDVSPFRRLSNYDDPPVLTTDLGLLFQSNAIVRYVAQKSSGYPLFGNTWFEQAQIEQWIDFSFSELDVAVVAWIYPVLGYIPENTQATEKARLDVNTSLRVLNQHLNSRTYLVGERLSVADIVVSCSLYQLMTLVLDKKIRNQYPNVNRWFLTCVNQPNFASALGQVKLCEKPALAPKPTQQTNENESDNNAQNGEEKKQTQQAEKPNQQKQQKQQQQQKQPSQENKKEKAGEEKSQQQQQPQHKERTHEVLPVGPGVYFAATSPPEVQELVLVENGLAALTLRLCQQQEQQQLSSSSGSESRVSLKNGKALKGEVNVARFLARSSPSSALYGQDVLSAAEVDEWLDASSSSSSSEKNLPQLLDSHLVLRTFVAGHRLSVADIALYLSLKDTSSNDLPHFKRWLSFVGSLVA